jgi:anti-anti-sigma factor
MVVICSTPAQEPGNSTGQVGSGANAAPPEGREHDRIGRIEREHEPASIDERGIRPPAAYSIAEGQSGERVTVLALRGELDIAAAPRLRARVDQVAAGRVLVIDFAEATFIDSAVLKELLRARAELAARDVRLVLAAVPPPVRRLLDLTRTAELFEDAPDAETAIKRVSG